MEDTLLAYLAGVIDSDGTIGVKRSTYAMRVRGDAAVPMYSERIALRQVTPEVVDILAEHFGGSRRIEAPQAPTRRPMFSWTATDLKAHTALVALRPFLRIKAAQADNAIALRQVKTDSRHARTAVGRGHVGGSARPQAFSEAMESIYQTAKSLNVVGAR